MRRLLAILAGLGSIAGAFDSVGWPIGTGDIHARITEEAFATDLGPRARRAVTSALDRSDWPGVLGGQADDPAAHFDRRRTVRAADADQSAHERAFLAGVGYLQHQADATVDALLAGSGPASAWTAFGRGLHAVQDFFAHSNYDRLSGSEQTACDLVLDGEAEGMLGNLRLCGWGVARDDEYPHGATGFPGRPSRGYNRDNAYCSAAAGGPAAFAAAYGQAVSHSRGYLRLIRNRLRARLDQAHGSYDGGQRFAAIWRTFTAE